MTHMSNYGNDRLASYTFESVIKFIQCWTNLRLSSAPPLQLGERYFQLYPEEADPVWGVSIDWIFNFNCALLQHQVFDFSYRIHATIRDTKKSGLVIKLVINCRDF